MSDTTSSVAVCIVTHNSATDLPACLEAISAQTRPPSETLIVDCASTDDSVEIARLAANNGDPVRVFALKENIGFSGGANEAIRNCRAPLILLLNPDARPESDYLSRLTQRLITSSDLQIGAVTGRLNRFQRQAREDRLDACGMVLSPTWRHFDRGSGDPDRGQLMMADRVFGATGAASLFVAEALKDVALGDDIFAPEFHSFREDAELCFRLRERGWEILYEPNAKCEHRRNVLPERRRQLAPEINYHSLKNRYLLRAYHQDLPNFLLTLVPTLFRDLLALVWVVTMERTSFAAYRWLWKQRALILERRREIMARRTAGSWEITRWFFRRSRPL